MSSHRVVLAPCLGVLLALSAHAAEPPAPVEVGVAGQAAASTEIRLPATVSARRVSALSVEAEGLVQDVLVDIGDAVLKDTPLLRLRPARKTLERDALQAGLEHARAAEQLAALKERRQAQLAEERMTPQNSHDVARAELAQARAAVHAAQAQLSRLDDEVARLELRAPYAGVISRKEIDPGAWVRPGDVVFELTETTALRLDFALPQQHFAEVAPGSTLVATLDAYPNQPLELRVTRVVPVVREAGRTLLTRAEFDNRDGRYAPGMSGTATLTLGGGNTVPSVPVDAVLTRPDGSHLVWRVDRGTNGLVATPVPLRVGRRLGDRYEVLEVLIPDGLPEGARVVVRGNERLRPGQPVTLTDAR